MEGRSIANDLGGRGKNLTATEGFYYHSMIYFYKEVVLKLKFPNNSII